MSADEIFGRVLHNVETSDGASISYVDEGEGEVVLLLHGYPQSHLIWRHQIGALSRTHRVIAPDGAGWGRSGRRADLRYDYKTEVQRLAAFTDAIGLERFNLVGHDYGGYLALGLRIAHPERVLRLAILNSRAHLTFPSRWVWLFNALGLLAHTPILGELYRVLPIGWMHRALLRRDLPENDQDPELLAEYTGWMDGDEGRRRIRRHYADYRSRLRPELMESLADITCPTAVIWGDQDRWCPPSIAVDLSATIASAELTRFPNGGHFSPEDEPTGVLTALQALLVRPLSNKE